MALFSIDILGLTQGTPKASDQYVAVDVTDPTMALVGTDKKYLLADIFTFIIHSSGFTTLPSSDAASTANYNAVYNNGVGGINATLTDASGTFAPFTIDGIPGVVSSLTTPHAYLIKNQTNPAQNGIYFLTINGNGTSIPWVLIRTSYFNSPSNIINGAVTMVTGGLTQASTAWQLNAPGTITVGTTALNWIPFTTISSLVTLPLQPQFGGTGIANAPTSTITLGGSLQTTGAFATIFNMIGPTNVTFPTTGTLATTSQLPVPAALTEINDTNVTMTLGGTPSTALLQAVSMTLGWTGQLAVPRGGTGDASFTAFSVICGGTTSTGPLQNVVGVGTLNQVLVSQGAGALPIWASVPGVVPAALTEVNDTNVTMTLGGTPSTALLQAVSMTLGWTGQLATPRGGTGLNAPTTHNLLIGNGSSPLTLLPPSATSGIPLISQGASLDPAYGTAVVAGGGTGNTTFTAFSVICAGTTATGPFQNVVGLGSAGQVLTSAGPGALPTWNNSAGSGTVNSGLINQLAWYAASGTIVSGLTTANNGLLVTSSAGAPSILAGPGTTGNVLQSNAAAAPSFSTATYPSTTTINNILFSSANNVVSQIATANSGVLVTSAGGTPSIASQIIAANIPALGGNSSGITFIGNTTHDISVAGTQAITGVGFQPSLVILLMASNAGSTVVTSAGYDNGTQNAVIYNTGGATASTWAVSFASSMVAVVSSGNQNAAAITAFGASGFTLTWTKTGTPTGTVAFSYLCFK